MLNPTPQTALGYRIFSLAQYRVAENIKQREIFMVHIKDVKEINASDWVTTTKEYARDHMKGEKGWHILSKKVKAKDIATDGNSIHEFGYDPQ